MICSGFGMTEVFKEGSLSSDRECIDVDHVEDERGVLLVEDIFDGGNEGNRAGSAKETAEALFGPIMLISSGSNEFASMERRLNSRLSLTTIWRHQSRVDGLVTAFAGTCRAKKP
mmetsp:Transcript_30856/g.57711  ORF Transcript_30856/g.57711 Transcript_30856/m.57711 type:complete len:115 (+) Transcript_30856:1219-1563(+)